MLLRLLFVLLLAFSAVGTSAQTSPALRIGQTFIAASLDPGQGSAGWALVSHGVAETLFTVSRHGEVVPALARSAEKQRDGSWIVTLRPDVRFSDGTELTAAHAAAALSRTNSANPAARASLGSMQLEALDRLRFRVRTERATPVMASVLAEWAFVIYKQGADGPVFTGPYRVEAFRPGDGLDLQPNPYHADAARRAAIRVKRFADAQTMALALEAGELDMAFNLPVEVLPRLRSRGITLKSFLVAYQYMMVINTRRAALADRRVRRALDLAIDRRELTLALGAGEAATGAFARQFPFAATAPLAYDPARAAQLLEEAGWRRDADGMRRKDGQPLEVVLAAYPQRPDLVLLQPVLRARLAALGVSVQTRVVEQASTLTASRDFDLLLWAQHTAPTGDPAFFLNAFFRSDSANNYAGLASPRIDAQLDRLANISDLAGRIQAAREVQEEVLGEAPVIFLMTPAWHVDLSARLAHYEPWGSDYYVIRADLHAR